ncbi:MAG: RNA polymerase sigma factor, partial [Candidatus Taylorbacteria bacterium]
IKKKRASSFSELDDNENDLSFADTLSDQEPNQAEIFDAIKTKEILAQIVDQLHPDHQIVISLHYQDELSFDEIAKIMNRPMNTVKSWHRRALIHMRKLLKNKETLYAP